MTDDTMTPTTPMTTPATAAPRRLRSWKAVLLATALAGAVAAPGPAAACDCSIISAAIIGMGTKVAAAVTESGGAVVAELQTLNGMAAKSLKLQTAASSASLKVEGAKLKTLERTFLGMGLNQSGERSQAKRVVDAQLRADFTLEIQKATARAEMMAQDVPSACYFETAAATVAGAKTAAQQIRKKAHGELQDWNRAKSGTVPADGVVSTAASVNEDDTSSQGKTSDGQSLFGTPTIQDDEVALKFVRNVINPVPSPGAASPAATPEEVVRNAMRVRQDARVSLAQMPFMKTIEMNTRSADLGGWASAAMNGTGGTPQGPISSNEIYKTLVDRLTANVSWSQELKQVPLEGLLRELARQTAVQLAMDYEMLEYEQIEAGVLGGLLATRVDRGTEATIRQAAAEAALTVVSTDGLPDARLDPTGIIAYEPPAPRHADLPPAVLADDPAAGATDAPAPMAASPQNAPAAEPLRTSFYLPPQGR